MPNRFNDVLPDSYYSDDTKTECEQCKRTVPLEDTAEFGGHAICSLCLPPTSAAFDYVVSICEQQEAYVSGLRAMVRSLEAEIRNGKTVAA